MAQSAGGTVSRWYTHVQAYAEPQLASLAAVGGRRRPNALGDPPPSLGQVQRGKSDGAGRESWEELSDSFGDAPLRPRHDQPGNA